MNIRIGAMSGMLHLQVFETQIVFDGIGKELKDFEQN